MNAILLASILALLLVTVHGGDISSQECGENEKWNECGTACPKTCENPNPQICTLQCVIGCQCAEGFVRNSAGKCIPPSQCCIHSG